MKQILLTKTEILKLQEILNPFINRTRLGKIRAYNNFKDNEKATHAFLEIINISVCPYCNINYIYTTECNKKGIVKYIGRPDFDHFVPKSKKSTLAMSCTNLVPSCQICNEKIKRNKPFSRKTHLHPYFDDFDSIKYFDLNLLQSNYSNKENFEIIFQTRKNVNQNDANRADENIKDLLLLERYKYHKEEIVFLFKRISRYSNIKKLSSIHSLVNGTSYMIKDCFPERFCEINETSLGKLKKDILEKYVK